MAKCDDQNDNAKASSRCRYTLLRIDLDTTWTTFVKWAICSLMSADLIPPHKDGLGPQKTQSKSAPAVAQTEKLKAPFPSKKTQDPTRAVHDQ